MGNEKRWTSLNNIDVEITLFLLGIFIGLCIAFLAMLYADSRAQKSTTQTIIKVKEKVPEKTIKSDDWKTYEKVYESEAK